MKFSKIVKWIRTARWNAGVLMIRLGYSVRKYQTPRSGFRWQIGVVILGIAYWIRGNTPMGLWFK